MCGRLWRVFAEQDMKYLSGVKTCPTAGGCVILLTAGQVAASSCLFSALGGDGQGLESAWGGPHIRAHTERSGVWARTASAMSSCVFGGLIFQFSKKLKAMNKISLY